MGNPRRVVVTLTTVALVAGAGAVTVDAVAASRVESEVSARIAPDAPGSPPPAVTVGGPTSRWSGPDTLATVAVRVEGTHRPGLGPVAVEAHATDVHVPATPADGLTAAAATVSVKITGASLAPALGMRDVVVGAADDPSLAGGTEHRARVTGTLEDSGERVSAIVDLVVDARGARLAPVAAATGPGGLPDQDRTLALSRTALTLDPDVLPLGATVDSLTVTGGTVTAAGTTGPGAAPLDDLIRSPH